MSSVATLGFISFTQLIEYQNQICELFDQDYEQRFDVAFSLESPNFDHLLRPKYLRAQLILRWIMGNGSDRPERISHEHQRLDSETQKQFDEFLYAIKDELPEAWCRRAASIYIPL